MTGTAIFTAALLGFLYPIGPPMGRPKKLFDHKHHGYAYTDKHQYFL
jgi:hypothetical protein